MTATAPGGTDPDPDCALMVSPASVCRRPGHAVAARRAAHSRARHHKDGKPCPTTRDFSVVDQDQSDNLPGGYLVPADGPIAQFSKENQRSLSDTTPVSGEAGWRRGAYVLCEPRRSLSCRFALSSYLLHV
jgi:hypothetical protein